MRTLTKHPIEFDIGMSYWTDFLVPSIQMLEDDSSGFDFKRGSFYTELPENAYLDRINDFNLSGIIPAKPLEDEKIELSNGEIYIPRCIFSTREEMKRLIYEYLQMNLQNKLHIYFKDEIAEFNSSHTIKEIAYGICMTRPGEQFVGIFSHQENTFAPLFQQQISRIICTAYNGEAFINWESCNS